MVREFKKCPGVLAIYQLEEVSTKRPLQKYSDIDFTLQMILVYPCVNLFFYARKINSQMKDLLKIKHPNTAFNQVRAHRSHLGTIQHNTATTVFWIHYWMPQLIDGTIKEKAWMTFNFDFRTGKKLILNAINGHLVTISRLAVYLCLHFKRWFLNLKGRWTDFANKKSVW